MEFQNVSRDKKKAVFAMVLEEACRQWCDCIDDAPERKDGEGFAEFFYGILGDKKEEYLEQVKTEHKAVCCGDGA